MNLHTKMLNESALQHKIDVYAMQIMQGKIPFSLFIASSSENQLERMCANCKVCNDELSANKEHVTLTTRKRCNIRNTLDAFLCFTNDV